MHFVNKDNKTAILIFVKSSGKKCFLIIKSTSLDIDKKAGKNLG